MMKDRRVRMVVEFDIDEESLYEKGLKAEDVLKHIVFQEHDVIDGFEISTNIPGYNCALNFFLCAGSVVSKEFVEQRNLEQVANLEEELSKEFSMDEKKSLEEKIAGAEEKQMKGPGKEGKEIGREEMSL